MKLCWRVCVSLSASGPTLQVRSSRSGSSTRASCCRMTLRPWPLSTWLITASCTATSLSTPRGEQREGCGLETRFRWRSTWAAWWCRCWSWCCPCCGTVRSSTGSFSPPPPLPHWLESPSSSAWWPLGSTAASCSPIGCWCRQMLMVVNVFILLPWRCCVQTKTVILFFRLRCSLVLHHCASLSSQQQTRHPSVRLTPVRLSVYLREGRTFVWIIAFQEN